jgi:Ca-activated chloride channel homolog
MSSTVDPATFVRPSTTIVATVDVSGSMGWDYPNETTAGSLSKRLLHEIADQLDLGDRFAMVTFGSLSHVVLPLTSGADQQQIHAAIDSLREDGSTDMEAGIRTSIPIAQGALGETNQVRIMVFSDYNPNVGATTPLAFQELVSQAADDGIGVTLFGLGLGLSPDVMKAMSEIRGANAFSAVDTIDVDKVMEDSWPWMVCPIAYDLRIGLKPSAPLAIAASFGFPGEAGDPEAALEVATVFLSRRKGGMLIKLHPTGDATGIEAAHAELQLDYVTPAGEQVSRQLEASYGGEALDESGQYMPQIGIAKATALALLVSGMREAAERYESEPAQAIEILQVALARYTSDVSDLEDAALNAEITFGEALLALMQQGASQGNFY